MKQEAMNLRPEISTSELPYGNTCTESKSEAHGKKEAPRSLTLNDEVTANKRSKIQETVNDEYEIKAIVAHKIANGRVSKYFVEWKDCGSEENTWEPLSHLRNSQEAIAEYFHSTIYKEVRGDSKLHCLAMKKDLQTFTPQEIDDASRIYFTENGKNIPEIDIDKLNSDIEMMAKIPFFARDESVIKQIKNNLLLLEIQTRRSVQLEELRAWEKEINDISRSPKPIKVINEVDLETMPYKFYYINQRIPGFGVKISADPQFIVHCNCKNCSKKCSCKTPPSYKNDGSLNVGKGIAIYECNFQCTCSLECTNRVVQRGRQRSLAIFKTSNGRGWGLKTLEKIQKGQFVTEYVGEVMLASEADARLKDYLRKGLGNYMFDLDFSSTKKFPYTIDGTWLGNESRFINHSCEPNLTVFCVFVDCVNPDLPHLALFANRTIDANEELTVDYFQDATKSKLTEGSSFFKVCNCGSDNCRKNLVTS